MTQESVIVRDRTDGRIVRLRPLDEPVKMRVCRDCGRVHATVPARCAAAA
jgi:hypothetical protein